MLPFVTQYQPSVPNLKQILMKNWYLIEPQPRLKEFFKEPPIISYTRERSLKDIIPIGHHTHSIHFHSTLIILSDWIYKKIPPNAGTIIIT